MPNRNVRRLEVVETEHIDAQVVGRDPLAVEGIDAAHLAEEVPSGLGVELILGQGRLAGEQFELALVNLDHECVLAPTDRAIAHGEFGEVGFDLETDRAAVATADIRFQWSSTHSIASGNSHLVGRRPRGGPSAVDCADRKMRAKSVFGRIQKTYPPTPLILTDRLVALMTSGERTENGTVALAPIAA